jgi:hypothetical protein
MSGNYIRCFTRTLFVSDKFALKTILRAFQNEFGLCFPANINGLVGVKNIKRFLSIIDYVAKIS